MNREATSVFDRVRRAKSLSEFNAGSEALPWIVGFQPPSITLRNRESQFRGSVEEGGKGTTHLERFVGRIHDFFQILHSVSFPFIEARLVESSQIGEMNLQPPQSSFSQRFRLSEHQQPSTHVVSDVGKIGRDRVGSTSEIEVVREIESFVSEGSGDFELVVQVATVRVSGSSELQSGLESVPVSVFRTRISFNVGRDFG